MSKKFLNTLFLLGLLIAGCNNINDTTSSMYETGTKVITASVTSEPTYLPSPTVISVLLTVTSSTTLTSVPTEVSQNVLTQECLDQSPNLTNGVISSGILSIASANGISLVDFSKQTRREIKALVDSSGTSPNGKWLGYTSYSGQQPQIVFESYDGVKSFQLNKGQGCLLLGRLQWLDNQRIWFPLARLDGSIAPVMVLNPFTGQSETIRTDYPGVMDYLLTSGGVPGLHFGYSRAVYDPSLNYVIYPELVKGKGWFQTLWDRKSQKALARIIDDGSYGNLPLWRGSQKQFLVVGYPSSDAMNKEWLSVNLDGHITKVTDFGKLGLDYLIENDASLSPDGKMLAFGLSFKKSDSQDFETRHLILLDAETKKATDTCIQSSYMPSWSLDGRYLAVPSAAEKNGQNQIILIDTKEKLGYQFLEGNQLFPAGWLIEP